MHEKLPDVGNMICEKNTKYLLHDRTCSYIVISKIQHKFLQNCFYYGLFSLTTFRLRFMALADSTFVTYYHIIARNEALKDV